MALELFMWHAVVIAWYTLVTLFFCGLAFIFVAWATRVAINTFNDD